MIKRLQLRVTSQKKRDGISEKKNSMTTSASASKIMKLANSILGKKKDTNDDGNSNKSKAEQTAEEAYKSAFSEGAEYSTNNGPTSKLILMDFQEQDLYSNAEGGKVQLNEGTMIKIANALTQFEAFVGDNIKKKKVEARKLRNEINLSYYNAYGPNYSDPQIIEAQESQLVALSFQYTRHQLLVAIESDEPILELSSCLNRNQSDFSANRYIYEIKSHRFYQFGYVKLTKAHIDALLGVKDDKVVKLKLARLPYSVQAVLKTDDNGNLIGVGFKRVSRGSSRSDDQLPES